MNDLSFVHRWAPGETTSRRVLLLLHGTGGDESDLLSLGRELDPTAALLSPRGNVLENGAPRFFRRFAEGVFDEADVIRRAGELADFVLAAAARHSFELAQLTAVGYSNGANIAAAVLFLRPEVFGAAILWRAMVPLSAPPSPDLREKRVLLSAGHDDRIIPRQNVEQLAALLKKRGADVTFRVQEASHGLVAGDISTAQEWLDNRR